MKWGLIIFGVLFATAIYFDSFADEMGMGMGMGMSTGETTTFGAFNVTDAGGEVFRVTDGVGEDFNVRE